MNAICVNRNGNPKLSRRGIVKDILVVSSLKRQKTIKKLLCLTGKESQSQISPLKEGVRGKKVACKYFFNTEINYFM